MWKLKEDEVKKAFQEMLSEKLLSWRRVVSDLTNNNNNNTTKMDSRKLIENLWASWSSTLLSTASSVLGVTREKNSFLKPWWNEEIREAIKERRKIHKKLKASLSNDWSEYSVAAKKVRKLVASAKKESWNSFMSEIEEASSIYEKKKKFFTLAKRLDKKKGGSRHYPLEVKSTANFFKSLGSVGGQWLHKRE